MPDFFLPVHSLKKYYDGSLVPRPLPVFQCSACNIEKLGVAWGRGYYDGQLHDTPDHVFRILRVMHIHFCTIVVHVPTLACANTYSTLAFVLICNMAYSIRCDIWDPRASGQ